MEITFKLEIKVMGAVRMTRNGKWVNKNAQRYLAYKDEIRLQVNAYMKQNGQEMLRGPIHVDMKVYMAVPNSYSKKRKAACLNGEEYPTKKPDIDNMFKGITDALNGICYEDDKQIITVTMGKFYAEKDYTEITITEVG